MLGSRQMPLIACMNKYFIKVGSALLAGVSLLSLVGAGCDTSTVSNVNTTPVVQTYQATTTATTETQDKQLQPSQETPPPVIFSHTLSLGSSGTEVANVQQFLADVGVYSGRNSGIFDQATVDAVIAFEQQQNISPANGVFGPEEEAAANLILASHPDWVTTLSNDGGYKNVNGSPVHAPAYSDNGIPAGASAICRDGTYSFSMHRRGTCSHHGGVSEWY